MSGLVTCELIEIYIDCVTRIKTINRLVRVDIRVDITVDIRRMKLELCLCGPNHMAWFVYQFSVQKYPIEVQPVGGPSRILKIIEVITLVK